MNLAPSTRLVLILCQIALAFFVLLPFFWMFSVSLKPATEPFAIPARLWPESPTLDNYVTAFRPEFRTYFMNSLIVSGASVVITVSLALLADDQERREYHIQRPDLAVQAHLGGLQLTPRPGRAVCWLAALLAAAAADCSRQP